MQNNITGYVLSVGVLLSLLSVYTQAKFIEQPNMNPYHNSNAGKGGTFTAPVSDKNEAIVPDIPQHIIDDIMYEYPDFALRVEMLRDDRATHNFIPRTLFLYGKPGCGKTTIALAIAKSTNRKIAFFESPSLVGDKYQNSGVKYLEKKLESILKDIEQNLDTKYVVIIDEIMRLVENHKSDRPEERKVATKLWLIMDKFKYSDRVFFIATANEIDDLPEQVESRFAKDDMIEITLPRAETRRRILLNCLNKQHSLSRAQLDLLVSYTDGLTHRDIETIVRSAARIAYKRNRASEIITFEALKEGIEKVKNIGFIAHRLYGSVNNWIIKPTHDHIIKPIMLNPVNSVFIQPFNAFCKKHKETLTNLQQAILMAGGTASVISASIALYTFLTADSTAKSSLPLAVECA